MERRVKHVRFQNYLQPQGMIDYYETKSQPITKAMVWEAYKEVKSSSKGRGIDLMSWDYLAQNASRELYKLWNRLSSGSYYPMSVKQVAIPKKGGGERKLGIPTILDRIAQQVVRKQLELQVEPLFHKNSFGYRPKRSSHEAVRQANANAFEYDFAIDLDIRSFFDTIDHDLMMKAVSYYCKDKWILMYVERWLKAGIIQQDGTFVPTVQGTPQGGVISPLLANIFLDVVFDKWMDREFPRNPFERYADDIVVHCKSEKQAVYLLHAITQRMQACKLQLHSEKTKIVNLRGTSTKKYVKKFDFLGFSIHPKAYTKNGKTQSIPGVFVSQKSKTSILQKFKSLSIHKKRKAIEDLAKELNPTIQGVINYYHKFWENIMLDVWNQLNTRLLKWVKWQKGLYKKAAIRYLQQKHKEQPKLFQHWLLVHP